MPPYVLAMIICDAVHQDPASEKTTLLGCFTRIAAHRFPVSLPTITAYVCLTGGRGKVQVGLRCVDADEQTLFETEVQLDFGDPREIIELSCPMNELLIPMP